MSKVIKPKLVSEKVFKSQRWVYAHAAELGASRIGGSWLFTEEGLEHALQRARRLESGSAVEGETGNTMVSDKERSSRLGKYNPKRAKDQEAEDIHGLAQFVR